jgi:hypothetical protein
LARGFNVAMLHYHIHWSNSMLHVEAFATPELDWEAFPTPEEAKAQAEQLVKPGESYVIVEVDGGCPRCGSLANFAEHAEGAEMPRSLVPSRLRASRRELP